MLAEEETQNSNLQLTSQYQSGHPCRTCNMFQFPGKRWGIQLEDLYTQFFLLKICQNLKKNPEYNLKYLNLRRPYDSFDRNFVIYVYEHMQERNGPNQCLHDFEKHEIKTKSKHQCNTRKRKRYEGKYKKNLDISEMVYLKAQQIYSEGRGTINLKNLIMDYQKRIAEQKLFEVISFSSEYSLQEKSCKEAFHSMETRSKVVKENPKKRLIKKDIEAWKTMADLV